MSELISSTKNQIKRIIPRAKTVLMKIERDHDLYHSKIHVHVPGKVLHAGKKAQTIWEAVDLSYHAILKQVDKLKASRYRRYSHRMSSLDTI